jgi:hypothetical protein
MAYVVGLFQADGANQVSRRRLTIKLKASDSAHLSAVASAMRAPRPLVPSLLGGVEFAVYSRRLSAGLASWGVVSPKTHTASTDPRLLFDVDYWRGVMDGDGTLCDTADGRRILALVGSRPVCDQFLAFCRAYGTGRRVNVHANRSIWTAKVSGSEAVTMARLLYGQPGLALPRKAAIAARWLAETRKQVSA